MDAAARKRKSREKLRSNPEKLEEFLKKERERDRVSRAKQRNIIIKSKNKLESSRSAARIRQRKCREKKKLSLIGEQLAMSPLGSYKCKQTLSKAVIKSLKALPLSPTKSQAVILELAKRNLPPGVINKKVLVEVPKRSDSIPEGTVQLIQSFYESDEVSRQTPNRKDVIRIKNIDGVQETKPKKHLVMTVAEVYELFKSKYPDIKVHRTKFFELRPFHVRVRSEMPHNVCVCVYHANFEFLTEALKDSLDPIITTYSQLLKEVCCDILNEKCMTGACQRCYDVSDVVTLNVDLTVPTQWKQWGKSTDGWLQIQTIQGTKKELLQEIEQQTPKFKTHCFIKKEQSNFFEKARLESSEKQAVMQIDFAENFSIISQDEIQSAHWRHPQVTLFTCCVWFQKGQKVDSYVVVSDDLSHDKVSVWVNLNKIFENIKAAHPDLDEVLIFSDGCAAQFKNRYTISCVYYSVQDWGVKVDWAFFATSHGKGAVDGLGAVAKRRLWNAIKARKVNINTAWDCYEYLAANSRDVTYLFVSNDDYSSCNYKEELMLRWQDLDLLLGIQKHHYFKHYAGKDISYSLTANSTAQITSLFKNKVNYRDVYSDSDEENRRETQDEDEKGKKDNDAENNIDENKKKGNGLKEPKKNMKKNKNVKQRNIEKKMHNKKDDEKKEEKNKEDITDKNEDHNEAKNEEEDEKEEKNNEDITDNNEQEVEEEKKNKEDITDNNEQEVEEEKKNKEYITDNNEQGDEEEKKNKENLNKHDTVTAGVSGVAFEPRYNSGDFVLVKIPGKKVEYRYVGIVDNIDQEEGEIRITYLRLHDDHGKLFKVVENDISDVTFDQIKEKLATPALVTKGDRIFYKFNKSVDVFEQ